MADARILQPLPSWRHDLLGPCMMIHLRARNIGSPVLFLETAGPAAPPGSLSPGANSAAFPCKDWH